MVCGKVCDRLIAEHEPSLSNALKTHKFDPHAWSFRPPQAPGRNTTRSRDDPITAA
jgi:hypothetical protein